MNLEQAQAHISRVGKALVTATGVPLGDSAETIASWQLLAQTVLQSVASEAEAAQASAANDKEAEED